MNGGVPMPSQVTGGWLREHWREIPLMEEEVVELVAALLDTRVVWTSYSCRGHFNFQDRPGFCHHNQKAQVHFQVADLAKAAALCDEILREVRVDGIEIEVRQSVLGGEPDDPVEVNWMLEYRPRGFWMMSPQDSGMLITVADGWTEERARQLIGEAFDATIEVCKNGRWRSGQDEPLEEVG